MAIYKTIKGERVKMSSREIKKYIMEANGWSSEEYDKKYDIFKNKLRAYESYERQHGRQRKPQSPVEILYKQARAKVREGVNYKPSIQIRTIERFTSVSSGAKGQKALEGRIYQKRRGEIYNEATMRAYEGLISKNPTAQRIVNEIQDPVQRALALKDLADKLKMREEEDGTRTENEAIPYGEMHGSGEAIDFDINAYL